MRKGASGANEWMKTIKYGPYTIKSFPLRQLATHDWKVNISIFWIQDGVTTMRLLTSDNAYPTEQGADLQGITYAQQIIDGELSSLSIGDEETLAPGQNISQKRDSAHEHAPTVL